MPRFSHASFRWKLRENVENQRKLKLELEWVGEQIDKDHSPASVYTKVSNIFFGPVWLQTAGWKRKTKHDQWNWPIQLQDAPRSPAPSLLLPPSPGSLPPAVAGPTNWPRGAAAPGRRLPGAGRECSTWVFGGLGCLMFVGGCWMVFWCFLMMFVGVGWRVLTCWGPTKLQI